MTIMIPLRDLQIQASSPPISFWRWGASPETPARVARSHTTIGKTKRRSAKRPLAADRTVRRRRQRPEQRSSRADRRLQIPIASPAANGAIPSRGFLPRGLSAPAPRPPDHACGDGDRNPSHEQTSAMPLQLEISRLKVDFANKPFRGPVKTCFAT